MGGENNDKTFEGPKPQGRPMQPGGPQLLFGVGTEGSSPKWGGPQQKSSPNPWLQGLGTDPWSSFQTNNPFASTSLYELGTQEPSLYESGFSQSTPNEEFPYTRPYRTLYPQSQGPQVQYPRPFMPDYMPEPSISFGGGPRGGPMSMGGQGQQMPPPPHQRQHNWGMGGMGMMMQGGWPRITGRSNTPEMPPPPSPFDFRPEYAPARPPNGTMSAITVQYNVTYTFTPWGWKTVDVSVSNATFHPTTSEKMVDISGNTGGGLVPQSEPSRNPEMFQSSSLFWWPKKTDPDFKPLFAAGKPEDGIEATGFADPASFTPPHSSP